MRQGWGDDRLDALAEQIAAGFAQVNQRLDAVDRRFGEVDRRFGELDQRIGRLEEKVDRLEEKVDRIMLGLAFTALSLFCVALIALVGS